MGSKERPCGNPECAVTSFITEQLCYGSGEMSSCGMWEFPCRICAEAAEKRDKAEGFHLKHPDWFPYLPTEPAPHQKARELDEFLSYN